MHSDWKYFTVDGIPFLFLANRFNTTNSAIYNYLPPPYVVIKSPTSGESNNYREWNPASTPITGVGSPTTHIMIYD